MKKFWFFTNTLYCTQYSFIDCLVVETRSSSISCRNLSLLLLAYSRFNNTNNQRIQTHSLFDFYYPLVVVDVRLVVLCTSTPNLLLHNTTRNFCCCIFEFLYTRIFENSHARTLELLDIRILEHWYILKFECSKIHILEYSYTPIPEYSYSRCFIEVCSDFTSNFIFDLTVLFGRWRVLHGAFSTFAASTLTILVLDSCCMGFSPLDVRRSIFQSFLFVCD